MDNHNRDQLKTLKEKRAAAANILENMKKLSIDVENTTKSIENRLNKTELIVNDLEEYKKVASKTTDEIAEKKDNISSMLSELQATTEEANNFLNTEYQYVVDELQPDEGPTAKEKVDEINTVLTTIRNNKRDVAVKVQEIENLREQYSELLKDIESYKEQYEELVEKIEDEDTGIDVTQDKTTQLYNSVKEIYDRISQLNTDVKEFHSSTKTKYDEIEKHQKEIVIKRDEITKIHKKINEIYSIASKVAQGGIFYEFQQKYQTQKWIWTAVYGVILALWISAVLVINLNGSFATQQLIGIGLFLLLPFLHSLYLLNNNIRSAQRAEEHYSYKTVLSFSISQQTKELLQDFKTKEKEILGFTLESLTKLFNEPFVIDSENSNSVTEDDIHNFLNDFTDKKPRTTQKQKKTTEDKDDNDIV